MAPVKERPVQKVLTAQADSGDKSKPSNPIKAASLKAPTWTNKPVALTGGAWTGKAKLAAEMDHGARQAQYKPPSGPVANVVMKGFEVVTSLLTPINDIRATQELKQRASWDPAAKAALASAERNQNFAIAATVFPAGKVFKLARLGEALAGPVAKVLEHLLVKEGVGFEKHALLDAVKAEAAERTVKATALGEYALGNVKDKLQRYGNEFLPEFFKKMESNGVRLSAAEKEVFKNQLVEEYALATQGKSSVQIVPAFTEAALKVAGERWGLGKTASGSFGTTLVGGYVADEAMKIERAVKAAGGTLSTEQATTLRETLTHCFKSSIQAADSLPGRARTDEFEKIAHQVGQALFGI